MGAAFIGHRPKSADKNEETSHHVIVVNGRETGVNYKTQEEAWDKACSDEYRPVHVARERHLQDRDNPDHFRKDPCQLGASSGDPPRPEILTGGRHIADARPSAGMSGHRTGAGRLPGVSVRTALARMLRGRSGKAEKSLTRTAAIDTFAWSQRRRSRPLTVYRIFVHDGVFHLPARDIDCASEIAALEAARTICGRFGSAEVWSGTRFLGRVGDQALLAWSTFKGSPSRLG